MDVVDAPIIDYGFQPIVNRLMIHPADIGWNTAVGGGVMVSVALICVDWTTEFTFWMAILGIFIQGFMIGFESEKLTLLRHLIQSDRRNPLRYQFLSSRLLMVITTGIMTPILFWYYPLIALVPDLFLFGCLLWCATLYFQSCDYPVRPLKVGRFKPA